MTEDIFWEGGLYKYHIIINDAWIVPSFLVRFPSNLDEDLLYQKLWMILILRRIKYREQFS